MFGDVLEPGHLNEWLVEPASDFRLVGEELGDVVLSGHGEPEHDGGGASEKDARPGVA